MTDFIRVLTQVDTMPLLQELDAVPELWLSDTSRQSKIRCQRQTQNIFLRGPKKPLPPGVKNANDVQDSRLSIAAKMFPCTLEFCNSMARMQRGTLGRATLVALLPLGRVFPHIDSGTYYQFRDRYHLVIRSSNGSRIATDSGEVLMREGEVWVFNNKVRHWAKNPSNKPRIHLIFDLLPLSGVATL